MEHTSVLFRVACPFAAVHGHRLDRVPPQWDFHLRQVWRPVELGKVHETSLKHCSFPERGRCSVLPVSLD